MITKDKTLGMFLGIPIGDALGMPVETWTLQAIAEKKGRITTYQAAIGHKWLGDWEAGHWTDDTQLSLAIANAMTENGGINFENVGAHQVKALEENTAGWGKSTKDSIQRIKDGTPWHLAGNKKGVGNGVAMKIAPFGAYLAAKFPNDDIVETIKAQMLNIANFTIMTHNTDLAIATTAAHVAAIMMCMRETKMTFSHKRFLSTLVKCSRAAYAYCEQNTIPEIPDNFTSRLNILRKTSITTLRDEKIVEMFSEGTCYIYNSLPFSYAFFLRNPFSIETLYDIINAGGDTDSNGSIVGAILGALNGTSIFPEHLIEGLWKKEMIRKAGEKFWEQFGT